MDDYTDPWPCKRCGELFERHGTTGSSRSWCRPCKVEYHKVYNAEYMRLHPEKYYKTCPQCGGQCAVGANVCKTCRKPPLPNVECDGCGIVFAPRNKVSRFCSQQCSDTSKDRNKYWRTVDAEYGQSAECAWCFTAFTLSAFRPCCSKACSGERDRHYTIHGASDRSHLKCCIDCHSPIAPSRLRRCDGCQVAFDTWRKNATTARRAATERAGDPDINWRTLGERDSWTCHLCGGAVGKYGGGATQAKGATVDHLIPVSQGGTHTWDNVALAHRSCNVSRGTRGLVQLRLVG